MSTGASKKGTLEALFKNMEAFKKLAQGYLTEPNPSSSSKAGALNKQGDAAYYECIKGSPFLRAACLAKNKVKYRDIESPPTSDPFLRKRKTSGEHSSSYYVKVGTCPRSDIKTENACSDKGLSGLTVKEPP